MEYHYTRPTAKSVPEAIAALEGALTSRKFSALWHLDMQAGGVLPSLQDGRVP